MLGFRMWGVVLIVAGCRAQGLRIRSFGLCIEGVGFRDGGLGLL